jgi:hypothetical protein
MTSIMLLVSFSISFVTGWQYTVFRRERDNDFIHVVLLVIIYLYLYLCDFYTAYRPILFRDVPILFVCV